MNRYQLAGIGKNIAGKIQEGIGKMIGNKSQQTKGRHRQNDGKSAKLFEDARELIRQSIKNR